MSVSSRCKEVLLKMFQQVQLFLKILFQKIMTSLWFLNFQLEGPLCLTIIELFIQIPKCSKEFCNNLFIVNALTMLTGLDQLKFLEYCNTLRNA